MLEVKNLSVSYGQHRALDNVSIKVDKGEIVVILGANGAGKSSLLRAIAGMSEGTTGGEVLMADQSVAGMPAHNIVEQGIALVPEDRGVFPDMTVQENLLLGAYTKRARQDQTENLERLLSLFPKLTERRGQVVRTMSGGEQQMVAIGRAMMSAPQILMLDEPSLGLSPLLCKELFHSLTEVRKSGIGILLVEQNAKQSLAIADRGYLLENTRIIGADSAENLANDTAVQKAYLGVSGGATVVKPDAAVSLTPDDKLASARDAARQALSFISAGSAPGRTKTDDVISGGVEELVRHAADISSRHTREAPTPKASSPAAPSRAKAKPYSGPGREVADVLAEIERAAREARLPREAVKTNGSHPPAPPAGGPRSDIETFDDLPAIEVWRREPEIEIYRRNDGKMKRIKGD
jgi:branched-chain amino acid transport system ATP-binding protein